MTIRRLLISISALATALLIVGCSSSPPGTTPDLETKKTARAAKPVEPAKKAIQTNSVDEWADQFGGVIQRINAAMLTPVAAILELYTCETPKDCDISLGSLPRTLGPAVQKLQKEITTLESLEPPARHQALHNSYLQTLKLRVEAFELYIAGVEDDNDTLLEAGDDAFTRAQQQVLNNLTLLLEFLREEEGLSPEEAWWIEFGAVQQEFLQNEFEIAPALEAFFYCETLQDCDNALKAIPSALRPGQARLAQLLVRIENLEVPATLTSCSKLHSAIFKSFRLRLEAYDLFIRGVEESNDDLLDEGNRAWTQSMDVGNDMFASHQDCTQSLQGLSTQPKEALISVKDIMLRAPSIDKEGWETLTDGARRFSVTVPTNWNSVIDQDILELDHYESTVEQGMVQWFWVMNPKSGANVMIQALIIYLLYEEPQPIIISDFVADFIRYARQSPGFEGDLDRSNADVDGLDATLVTYKKRSPKGVLLDTSVTMTYGNEPRVGCGSLIIMIVGGVGVHGPLTASAEILEIDRTTVDQIIDSIQILPEGAITDSCEDRTKLSLLEKYGRR